MTEAERQELIEKRFQKLIKQQIYSLLVDEDSLRKIATADVDWFISNLPQPAEGELRDKIAHLIFMVIAQPVPRSKVVSKGIKELYPIVNQILSLLPYKKVELPENPYKPEAFEHMKTQGMREGYNQCLSDIRAKYPEGC